jgi:hypothetical protein
MRDMHQHQFVRVAELYGGGGWLCRCRCGLDITELALNAKPQTPAVPHPDSVRLDWLESQKYHEVGIVHVGRRWHMALRLAGEQYTGENLRDAIDAAMAATPERPVAHNREEASSHE